LLCKCSKNYRSDLLFLRFKWFKVCLLELIYIWTKIFINKLKTQKIDVKDTCSVLTQIMNDYERLTSLLATFIISTKTFSENKF
jgi:hypothetical protein